MGSKSSRQSAISFPQAPRMWIFYGVIFHFVFLPQCVIFLWLVDSVLVTFHASSSIQPPSNARGSFMEGAKETETISRLLRPARTSVSVSDTCLYSLK